MLKYFCLCLIAVYASLGSAYNGPGNGYFDLDGESTSTETFDGVSSGGGADSCAVPRAPFVYRCHASFNTPQGFWRQTFEFTNRQAEYNESLDGTGNGEGFSLMLCPEQRGRSPLTLQVFGRYEEPRNSTPAADKEIEVSWAQREFGFQLDARVNGRPVVFQVNCLKVR